MAMATIHCRDCGQARHGCPSNTRYCKLCRQLRELDYWRSRTRRCSCGAAFAPLGRYDQKCSTCNPGLRQYSGTCALSPRAAPHEGRYPEPYLPVCDRCARDPRRRAALFRALERGQQKRRTANAPEEASDA